MINYYYEIPTFENQNYKKFFELFDDYNIKGVHHNIFPVV